MRKYCAICGKPSGMYPLCSYHNRLKEEGEVVKCEYCGAWHIADERCECGKYSDLPLDGFSKCIICGEPTRGYAFCHDCYNEYSDDELIDILNGERKPRTKIIYKDNTELTCLICGKPSNGKHFCLDCYNKYKNKSIDVRIANCNYVEILDNYGNKKYHCENGIDVRSQAEQLIANWLYAEKIPFAYEKEFYYKDENGETKKIHPDFYLSSYNIYIEYNGMNDNDYLKRKEYAQKIYKNAGAELIIMTAEDTRNLSAFLKPKLNLH